MTKVPDLTTELTDVEDGAFIYVYSPANPSTPDAKMKLSNLLKQVGKVLTPSKFYAERLQLTGAKLTRVYRAAGNLAVPALASNAESDIDFSVAGAAAGDSVIFNPTAAPVAELAITAAWVSGADTVKVRVRNLGAGSYAGGNLAGLAVVVRSAAADT